jgi:hypothetical protein
MYIYIYVCVYTHSLPGIRCSWTPVGYKTCMYACMYVCMYVYTRMRYLAYVAHGRQSVIRHVCMYVCMHVCMCAHACATWHTLLIDASRLSDTSKAVRFGRKSRIVSLGIVVREFLLRSRRSRKEKFRRILHVCIVYVCFAWCDIN